jgi:putative aldouronate transport system substrate-binding protein
MSKKLSRRELLRLMGAGAGGALLAACQPKTVMVEKEVEKVVTQVVKEVVKETVIVEGTPETVEKEVTKVVEKVVTATPAPAAPKLITYVDSAGFGVPQYKESIDPIAEALSQKMQAEGVNLQLRVLLLDDPVNEYPLLFASGAEFTFAFDAPWKAMNSLRDQGYLRPLENLLPDYPNIIEAITPEVIEYNYMLGHLYGLPTGFYVQTSAAGTLVYRQDLAEKYGLYPITSLDELEVFFDEILANEPGMIPFGADPTFNAFYLGGAPWGWYQPEQYPPKYSYNPGNAMIGGQVEDVLRAKLTYVDNNKEDSFRASVDRARQWQEKGYVNKNMLQLLEVNAFDEFFNPGKCGAIAYNEGILKAKMLIQPALQTFIPEAKAAGFDQNQTRAGGTIGFAQFKQWNFQVFNSNMALEDTKAGLQFFDWLLADQDNIDIWLMGIDGVNYKKLPNMRYEDLPDVDGTTNYRRRWYVAGVPGRFERVPADASDEYLEVLEYITNPEYHMPNPMELFEPDRKVVETELAQCQAAETEALPPLEAGEVADINAGIAAYGQALDAAGRQVVKAVFQEQLDAWLAENQEQFDDLLGRAQAKYAEWEAGPHAEWLAARK